VKLDVKHVFPGYKLATSYPIHLTMVKEFTADDIQAVANGTNCDTAILQGIAN